MEYRIEKREAFRVVGYVMHTTNENGEGMKVVPGFWGETFSRGRHTALLELMNQSPFGLLGVNIYNTDKEDGRKFDYMIGCATDRETGEGMDEYTVDEACWAVFPCKRDEVGKVEVQIVMEWLPASGYELLNSGYETGVMVSGAPDIEVYGQGDDAEVWVAVKEK